MAADRYPRVNALRLRPRLLNANQNHAHHVMKLQEKGSAVTGLKAHEGQEAKENSMPFEKGKNPQLHQALKKASAGVNSFPQKH